MKNLKNWMPALFVLALTLNSCILDFDGDGDGFGSNCVRGSGPNVVEVLDINEFDGLSLQIAASVFITQGTEFEVRAEGQENIIRELELDVRDRFWEIEFDRCVRNADDLRIYITMPAITELQISGSGDIFGENVFVTDDLFLRISGSGDMNLGLDADDVNMTISGSGRMRLEGTADDLSIQISGSGDIFAFDLASSSANVNIRGSGDAEVAVESALDVRISGSGDVFYKGNPVIDSSISGSGEVIDAN
ncbi:MAG: head GIN domain-containing protein [Bacteroidota bacterium]